MTCSGQFLRKKRRKMTVRVTNKTLRVLGHLSYTSQLPT